MEIVNNLNEYGEALKMSEERKAPKRKLPNKKALADLNNFVEKSLNRPLPKEIVEDLFSIKAPREFWLNPNPDNRGWSNGKPDQHLTGDFPPIHVIEKSYAERLEKQVEELKENFKRFGEESDRRMKRIEKERDALKAEFEQAKQELEKEKLSFAILHDQTSKDFQELNSALETSENQRRELEGEIERLKKDYVEPWPKVAELQGQQEMEIRYLKAENEKLRERISWYRSGEFEEQIRAFHELERELTRLRERIKELEK